MDSRSAAELGALMTEKLAGFQIAQALHAVARLGIPQALLDGPRTVADLAATAEVDEHLLGRVLHTLTGQGVFTHQPDGTVAVTELGATLAPGTRGSVYGTALFWMETHYAPFAALTDVLRTGRTASDLVNGMPFVDFLQTHPEHVPALTAAMADVTHGAQSEVLEGYRLPPGTVADIGGADGSVLAALVADEPDRRGWLVDLPAVAATAHEQLATAGLADRVEVLGGDFFESVPSAQVYLLSTVLHDWDDEDALRILGRIRAAAPPGARLVVVEVVLPDGDEPHLGKISDLTMLTMAGGRERRRSEFAGLLDRSGFVLDRVARSSVSGYSVLEATVRED
ncbi:methyltransferase [Pseudonocardia sp. ICBG1293]|uniref:methyltransferase n=1 Tax=Pseudonocardia sp. ICBG1293 TaxID=2844382 RepID=UPI001CCE83CB|nr:methyltransferase [Pseudonocardia sp. ICBG1293]